MRSLALALVLSSAPWARSETCPSLGDGWTTKLLSSDIDFYAHHKVVDSTLHLRLEGKTTGWLGFGFGEPTTGHMKGADMMTAYIAGDAVTVDDRYATFVSAKVANGAQDYTGLTAVKDKTNDWTIEWGLEADGVTTVYAKRALDTGDTQDRVISTTSAMRIVWAYGDEDSVAYHGAKRGSTEILFGGSLPAFPTGDGSYTRTVTNYPIRSSLHTTYACESMELPSDKDRWAIAFRPIFSEDTRKHVHHMILHTCEDNAYWQEHHHTQGNGAQPCRQGGSQGTFEGPPAGDTNPGAGLSNSAASSGCVGMMWSWASGQGDFILPSDVGFKFGSSAGKTKLILEVHYDNPELKTDLIDSVGFQLVYTETAPTHNAGWLWVGDPAVELRTDTSSTWTSTSSPARPDGFLDGPLPAGQSSVHRQATCSRDCLTTTKSKPSDNPGEYDLNVFALFHHMHYYGERIYLEQYRTDASGTNLVTTVEKRKVDFWDNAFQTMVRFGEGEFVIKPNTDELQTQCFFNTAGKTGTAIAFGQGTPEEMCIHAMAVYPEPLRDGNAVTPLDQCGYKSGGNTICGGDTSGQNVITGGQQWRAAPTTSTFGTTTKTAAYSPVTEAQCVMPKLDTTISFSITVSGSVDTYNTDAVKDGVAQSVAAALFILPSQVTVTVTAASVVLGIAIATTSAAAGGITTALTSTHLASNSAAATLISTYLPSGVTVSVESVTQPTTTTTGASDEFPIVAVVASIAGVVLVAVLVARFRAKKNKLPATKQAKPAQTTTSKPDAIAV